MSSTIGVDIARRLRSEPDDDPKLPHQCIEWVSSSAASGGSANANYSLVPGFEDEDEDIYTLVGPNLCGEEGRKRSSDAVNDSTSQAALGKRDSDILPILFLAAAVVL